MQALGLVTTPSCLKGNAYLNVIQLRLVKQQKLVSPRRCAYWVIDCKNPHLDQPGHLPSLTHNSRSPNYSDRTAFLNGERQIQSVLASPHKLPIALPVVNSGRGSDSSSCRLSSTIVRTMVGIYN